MKTITLYSSSLSLYAGRARSYLINANLDFRETIPNTQYFRETVLPKAGNRQSLPTIELPDGEVIRDGAAIIDHFESANGHRFSPTTPKHRVLSRLFDVIGAEGLLRPAMHYRWNFDDVNKEFLQYHFSELMPSGPNRIAQAEKSMNQMRNACMAFGAVPDTFEVVEALYTELLAALNAHFSEVPYLLGNKPCIGDFGMIAPLFAHLGRDPKPLSMMQSDAVRLFRWVERMNRPEPDIGEFAEQTDVYLANDEVPQTLINLLRQIAIDFVPETKAAAETINHWLAQQPNLAAGTQVQRGVGMGSFEVRGVTVNALAQPYRFYLLSRVQQEFQSLTEAEQNSVTALLKTCHMEAILDCKISRDIGRKDNLEVWL